MKEVFRSNDPIKLSYLKHCLEETGVKAIELDMHTSIIEGSIGAIQRRIMVIDDQFDAACKLIAELDL
jgi:hypothetical protein